MNPEQASYPKKDLRRRMYWGVAILIIGAFAFRIWSVGRQSSLPTTREELVRDPFRGLVMKDSWDEATRGVMENKLADMRKMHADKPSIWETWIGIGNLRSLFGDYAGAISAYEQSLAITGNNILGYRNIAMVYENDLRDYTKAADAYRKAIQNSAYEPDMYNALALLLANRLDNRAEAEQTYILGLQRTGGDPTLFRGLIRLYKEIGDRAKEKQTAQMFIARYPDKAVDLKTEFKDALK